MKFQYVVFCLLLFLFFVACNDSDQEFPLYKMTNLPAESVHVGGIIGEYFLNNEVPEKNATRSSKFYELNEKAIQYANTGASEHLTTCEEVWDSFATISEFDFYNSNEIIDWLIFSSTLLKITADSKYADQLEETIYNPLLINANQIDNDVFKNKLSPMFYARNLDQVYVNVFGNSSMEYEHTTGGMIRITQETNYPYDGLVRLKFETDDKRYVDLHIRIPKWAEKASVTVGGVKYKAIPGKYAQVTKKWKTGNEVEIVLPMRPHIYSEKTNALAGFKYGVLNMMPVKNKEVQDNKEFKFKGDNLYQHLKFVSPPGEVPTFTFSGIKDTTLVFQPEFVVHNTSF